MLGSHLGGNDTDLVKVTVPIAQSNPLTLSLGRPPRTVAKIEVSGKTDADLCRTAVAAKLGDEMFKDASNAEPPRRG